MDKLKHIREQMEKMVGYPLNINSRKRDVIYSRSIYFALAKDIAGERYTLEVIGESLGKDHSTVIHSLRNTFEHAMESNFHRDMYYTIKDSNKSIFNNKGARRNGARNTREYVSGLKKHIDSLYKENDRLVKINRDLRKNQGNDRFAMMTFHLDEEQVQQILDRVNLMVRMLGTEANG